MTPSGRKALLLGSGELGKEVAIELQRYGVEVVACDKYPNAPAMQVAHRCHVFNMLDPEALRKVIEEEKPDHIIPEVEAIATPLLVELEKEGYHVTPTARAAWLTMNREGIRRLAAEELGLPTSPYRFASSKEEFEKRIKDNTLTDILRSVEVKKGDCFFIPSGTIHAIGKGMLIAEIQQNSNCTYRVYDYGRLGADGKPRQLHIEKALDGTKTEPASPVDFGGENVLADCKYFNSKLLCGPAEIEVDGESFSAILVIDGEGGICAGGETLKLKTGDSIFLPASIGKVEISGNVKFIETRV